MRGISSIERACVVRASLSYWKEKACYHFDDTRNTDMTAVTHVKTIKRIPRRDDVLYCAIDGYSIATERSITYARHTISDRNICLPVTWFEKHYPGALAQVMTALDLGLTPEEVAQYALGFTHVDLAATLPDNVLPDGHHG